MKLIDLTSACSNLTHFEKKSNDQKRKLCESTKRLEKIVKSLQVTLILGGFQPLGSTVTHRAGIRYVSYLTKATAIEPKAAAL